MQGLQRLKQFFFALMLHPQQKLLLITGAERTKLMQTRSLCNLLLDALSSQLATSAVGNPLLSNALHAYTVSTVLSLTHHACSSFQPRSALPCQAGWPSGQK
jgi:hypothetical protein